MVPTLTDLRCQAVVLLLLLWAKGIPPFPQDLRHCSVVLVGVALVHQRPVSLAEDHEGIHRPPDVFLVSFTLQGVGSIIIIITTVSVKEVYGRASI